MSNKTFCTDKGTVYAGVPNRAALQLLLKKLGCTQDIHCCHDQFPMYVHFYDGDFSHNTSGAWMSSAMPRVAFEDWAMQNLCKAELLVLWLESEKQLRELRARVFMAVAS